MDFQRAFKLNFATQPIYLIAICVVKESIGFFLLRIAVQKMYKRIIIGIMGQLEPGHQVSLADVSLRLYGILYNWLLLGQSITSTALLLYSYRVRQLCCSAQTSLSNGTLRQRAHAGLNKRSRVWVTRI